MPRRGRGSARWGAQGRGESHTESRARQSNVHLSLNEEARNTGRHHSWNSDLKLRHSQVAFVSAGAPKAEDLTQTSQGSPNERDEKFRGTNEGAGEVPREISAKHSVTSSPIIIPDSTMSNMSLGDVQISHSKMADRESTGVGTMKEDQPRKEEIGSGIFFTDVNGFDKPVCTGFTPPVVKSYTSSAASDSSDEIILFAGRNTWQGQPQQNSDSIKTSSIRPSGQAKSTHRSYPTVIQDSPHVNLDGNGSVPSTSSPRVPTAAHTSDISISGKDQMQLGSNKRRHRKPGLRSSKPDDDTTILADYIANICDSVGQNELVGSSAFNRRDPGGFDGDWQNEEEVSVFEAQLHSTLSDDEWDSADLQDFNDLSTSSEFIDAIERILLKRGRPSGVQYLVTTQGCITDDARWVPLEMLESAGAGEKVWTFEQEQAELKCRSGSSEESEDSLTIDKQVPMDLEGELDDLLDEYDLEQRRKDRMTDEKIAQLLSKQEELGLGSNDLMLFDGEDIVDNVMGELPLDGSSARQPLLQRRPKQKKRHRAPFPSATLFADVLDQDLYDGFDIMDHERPSLRRSTKGRRRTLALELSDSELEHSVTLAWENDRAKKKLRKQEREELRAQGFLGKKDKVDMKAKYAEGMSMDAIKNEIREFLISNMQSLPLPPMAQKERKTVHEIANIFKLKSKSIGAGKSRFPVLYRTARTMKYDEHALTKIDIAMSSKRFLPRQGIASKRETPRGKARGGYAGIVYRDGEVVGAAAPELGQDNKGRAMLEKMGWSTGTTLGALNNTRGIAQPVTQVVKTGKAGLG